jgi:hypothetical protein
MTLCKSISSVALVIIVLSSAIVLAIVVLMIVGTLAKWDRQYQSKAILDGLITALVLIAIACYGIKYFADGKDRDRILRTGATAEAQILEVRNGGYSSSSGSRQAKLLLEVYPEARASFQARAELWVGVGDARLLLSPGQRLQVFIDPDDPGRVAVPRSVSLMP